MGALPDAVTDLLAAFLPEYREDRRDIPLWTYSHQAWEDRDESWFELVQWSPGLIVQGYLGQAGGLAEHLHHLRGPDARSPHYVARFEEWPHGKVIFDDTNAEEPEGESVPLPLVSQAQIAGLYAALDTPQPSDGASIGQPEHVGGIDFTGAREDLRRAFDELFGEVVEALTSPVSGPDGQSVPLLEQLRHDYGHRTARDTWLRDAFDQARQSHPDEESLDLTEAWLLRHELDPREVVSKVLKRADIPPRLQGNKKTILSLRTIFDGYREALDLVERYTSWKPTINQLRLLSRVLMEDEKWDLNQEDESALEVHLERKERGEDGSESDFVQDLRRWLRWLRFPYLSHPSPLPLRESGSRYPKKAARGLLLSRLPAAVTDENLRTSYLPEARERYGDS